MRDLFKNVPIAEGLEEMWGEIQVLDLTLAEYFSLFYADKAPAFSDRYHKDQSEDNVVTKLTSWFSPPEERFKTFNGLKCTKQRDYSYNVYVNWLYPELPMESFFLVCE
jgi:hypothetical protein